MSAFLGTLPFAAPARGAVTSAPYVRPVPSGTLAKVVADAGHAYGLNTVESRVEVLSLATGALEAPVPVNTHPLALDFSADGHTLYVLSDDSQDISVVDLDLRREVRRIAIPQTSFHPFGIAVAGAGRAFITGMSLAGDTSANHLLQVDLATGAVVERTPWFGDGGSYGTAYARASRDRSRLGFVRNAGWYSQLAVYTAATDTFGAFRNLSASTLALDATGATMLGGWGSGGAFELTSDLALKATVAGATGAVALNGPGTVGYRAAGDKLEVLDIGRGLAVATLPVPGGGQPLDLALTPDDATVIVAGPGGFGVVPVSGAVPIPCPPPAGPAGVVKVCGAPLADLALDDRGRAYASNTARNQIEVVSLTTGALDAPILVGSQPTEIDITADRSTLVVVNSGADDLSVVDLVARREVRRIPIPGAASRPAKVVSLAVAGSGTALVVTQAPQSSLADRLLQVDLATGTVRERTDFPALSLAPSGDHSRIVAAPDVRVPGAMRVYSAATDTFGPSRPTNLEFDEIALDRTGDHIVVSSATSTGSSSALFDGDLVRRATFPYVGYANALDPAGRFAYQAGGYALWVLDLERGLPFAQANLADYAPETTSVAVTADGATAGVTTRTGLVIVPLGGANRLPACLPPARPAGVAATCGPLAEVVVDATGHAFATDPSLNQVQVVALATGALEAPIPVGSQPQGIDLSVDGKFLYVANAGAQEISVIDIALRREVRRITVPAPSYDDGVWSIAVAANGAAFYTTTGHYTGSQGHVYQLDLASGAATLRTDTGIVTSQSLVRASGDRTRIVLASATSGGPVWVYSTATDAFGDPSRQEDYPSFVAVDAPGARLLLGPGGRVLGEDLQTEAQIPSGGKGVAISADGKIGYRVQESLVEVLDLDRAVVVRTIALPDSTRNAGAVDLSPDGATLAVLTDHGVTAVLTGRATLGGPYSVWRQPAPDGLDGVGSWMAVANNPVATASQLRPQYLYGHYFGFAASPTVGVLGLATEPSGRFAVFSVPGAGGAPQIAAVPFDWSAGHAYFLLVYQVAPGTLGAWVYDNSAGTWTGIGLLTVPGAWGKLGASSVTGAGWYGATAASCSAYPRAEVVVYPPTGYVGTTPSTAVLWAAGQNPGDCAPQTAAEPGGWTRYRLGA